MSRNDHKSQKVLHSHSCALSMHDRRRQKMAVAVGHNKAQSERMKQVWDREIERLNYRYKGVRGQ